jgi:hypothetical protein
MPHTEGGQTMVELEVCESSRYDELANNALRKLGLRESDHNMRLMTQEIKTKVETYVRQLSKKVKQFERQRTFERSYLAVNKK